MNQSEIAKRLEFAKTIGIAAGKQTLDLFQKRNLHVDLKGDSSPVTEADRNAEKLMRQQITENFPDDGIVGEEFGTVEGNNSVRWILDPIDGTKSFISGVPLFGTMVGVEIEGRPEIGVVYIPGLDEGVFASRGNGAWHFCGDRNFRGVQEPTRCHVADDVPIERAIMVTSESKTFATRGSQAIYDQLAESFYFVRTWGDCYGYLLVATGRAHLMIDPILSVWDAAAIAPIIEEAGGKYLDWNGEAKIDSGDAIGTTKTLADQILTIIRQF